MSEEKFRYYPSLSRERERPRFMLHTGEETPVQQQFKDECDINHLMRKYQETGLIPQSVKRPFYGDFTEVPDYQAAMNVVNEAQALFMSMPSEVRKEFDNDPAKFLEYCRDPKNGDRLIELGLREKPKPEPGPVRVEVVNQVAQEDPPAPK